MLFELIIMVSSKNIAILKKSIPYIVENINPQKIIGIGANFLEEDIKNSGIEFLDEDKVLPGLSFEIVKNIIEKNGCDVSRTGWYFQQFLKYAYSFVSETCYYLSWDSDTIPLNKLDYFNNNTPCFIIKKEYHKAYFDTIDVLFKGSVRRVDSQISFIAENMMFNKYIVQEIISVIESNDRIDGERYFEKILNAVRKKDFFVGFSEFETYGNYVMTKHPSLYGCLKRRTLRYGTIFLGSNPSVEQIEWAKQDFDIITFEGNRGYFANITNCEFIRKLFTLKILVRLVMPARSIKRRIQRKEIIRYD